MKIIENTFCAVIVFLALIGFLWYTVLSVTEGFESAAPAAAAMPSYPAWRDFFLTFMEAWKKALVTSVALERPAPTEGSPAPPSPTVADMNQYAGILIQQLSHKLPAALEDADLPPAEKPDLAALQAILTRNEPADYHRAIQWVNEQLEASFKALENPVKEPYLDVSGAGVLPACQDYASCLEENPEQADRLWSVLEKRKQTQTAQQKVDLEKKMRSFLDNAPLRAAMEKNKALVAKAKDVEKKATSGALLGELKLPGTEESAGPAYQLPAGANRLKELQSSDPEKYKEYQKSFGALVSLKSTMDQINGGLR